jgi:hypothetical protein
VRTRRRLGPLPALAALAALPLAASELPAQLTLPRGLEVAVFGGGTAFGDFQEQLVLLREPGEPPDPAQPRRRVITARTSTGIGAALTYWITPLWGVRLHQSAVSSRFVERFEEEVEAPLRADPEFQARPDFARLRVRSLDLSGLFRVPARVGELSAYGLAGVGRVRYLAAPQPDEPMPAGAEAGFGETERFTSWAGVGGIGAHYPLGRVRLIAEATAHVARSPLQPLEPVEVFRSERWVVEPAPEMNDIGERRRGERLNTIRFVAGASVSLGPQR